MFWGYFDWKQAKQAVNIHSCGILWRIRGGVNIWKFYPCPELDGILRPVNLNWKKGMIFYTYFRTYNFVNWSIIKIYVTKYWTSTFLFWKSPKYQYFVFSKRNSTFSEIFLKLIFTRNWYFGLWTFIEVQYFRT